MNKYQDLLDAWNKTDLADHIDIEYYLNDFATWDEFTEYVEERIYEQDVIYYSTVIKYLAENDPSLRESLGIAQEYGCDIDNLNSEYLATLLLQQNLMEEFYNLDNFEHLWDEEEQHNGTRCIKT